MQKTNIPWTEWTWNVNAGCTKVSAGCQNCYACELHTLRHKAFMAGKKLPVQYAKPFSEVQCFEGRLDEPIHHRKPRMIFVDSMSDLFHPAVSFDFIDKVMAVIALCPQHTFQLLTKRAERRRKYYDDRTADTGGGNVSVVEKYLSKIHLSGHPVVFPEVNLWQGVTCCNQPEADKNIPHLLQTPAAVRFLSLEPLLERIVIHNWTGIDWVIIGAESGPKRRPCKLEHVYSIAQQCQDAGVLLFVKQLDIDGKLVRDIEKFPKDLQLRQMPGKGR